MVYNLPPIKQSHNARYGSSYLRRTDNVRLSNIKQSPKASVINQNKSFLPNIIFPNKLRKEDTDNNTIVCPSRTVSAPPPHHPWMLTHTDHGPSGVPLSLRER